MTKCHAMTIECFKLESISHYVAVFAIFINKIAVVKKSKIKQPSFFLLKGTDVDYRNLYDRGFLNKWLTVSSDEKKKPGTLKTYLGNYINFFNIFTIYQHR